MKAQLILTGLSVALAANAASGSPVNGIDLSNIPPARTAQEAYDRFDQVKQLVIRQQATYDVGQFLNNGHAFTTTIVAKLAAGQDVDQINRVLLDPATNVFAKTGTDFHDVFFCNRTGDYDFALKGLIEIVYQYGDKPWLLYPETRAKIINSLLDKKGNQVETTFSLGVCGKHPETENHILMTEGSRYLTNQLMAAEQRKKGTVTPDYDNERNGMNKWMLKHLQQFFQDDFYEYNARPYQAYTVMAIENLAEYAEDARVKLAAEMLLNYLDARYAVSSNNLRRYVPFRRQPPYRTRTDMVYFDDQSQRMTLMAGATELYDELATPNWYDTGGDRMLLAAIGQYRTPKLILDLIVNRRHAEYFQAFHHTGIEIYASSKDFLITAGGVYMPVFDFFSDQMNGWAMPTSLMPTHGGLDASQFVRFMGQNNDADRINTCVAPGFACGLNPSVPASIPTNCLETQGNWTFMDFTSDQCKLKYGFFAALYTAPCDGTLCSKVASTYGFFEAAEASDALDYAGFKQKVQAANGKAIYHSSQENEYFTANGHRIRFLPIPANKLDWSIRAIDGKPTVTDMSKWPLAFGDIINADGNGLVEIHNPPLHRKLVLDMRDEMNPSRNEYSEE